MSTDNQWHVVKSPDPEWWSTNSWIPNDQLEPSFKLGAFLPGTLLVNQDGRRTRLIIQSGGTLKMVQGQAR
jgi:hypothetical protein